MSKYDCSDDENVTKSPLTALLFPVDWLPIPLVGWLLIFGIVGVLVVLLGIVEYVLGICMPENGCTNLLAVFGV